MEDLTVLRECATASEARMLGELLELNGIECQVTIDEPLPGLVQSALLLVKPEDEAAAHQVCDEQTDMTEAELAEIAADSKPED